MMKAAPKDDMLAEAPVAQIPPVASKNTASTTELELSDLTVLQAAMSHGEPITAGRLVKTTGLPAVQLHAILESLHELRLLRRLNTIVPSYTAHRQ